MQLALRKHGMENKATKGERVCVSTHDGISNRYGDANSNKTEVLSDLNISL